MGGGKLAPLEGSAKAEAFPQLFSDPGKKGNPFCGLDNFSGATKNKKGKREPLNN